MTDFRDRDHGAHISRDLLTDLWRVDCPTCGPVAIGQGYRVDVVAIAAQHREAFSVKQNELPESAPEIARDAPDAGRGETATELPGRGHAGRVRTHRLPSERRELDPAPFDGDDPSLGE